MPLKKHVKVVFPRSSGAERDRAISEMTEIGDDPIFRAIRCLYRRSIVTKLELSYLRRHVMPNLDYKQPTVYARGFYTVTPDFRRAVMRALACRDPEYFSELARSSSNRIGHTAFLANVRVLIPGVPTGCCGVFGDPIDVPVSLAEIRDAVEFAFAECGDIDMSKECKDRALAKAGDACPMCGRPVGECGRLWVRSLVVRRDVNVSLEMYDDKWDDPFAMAMCKDCFRAWQRYADELGLLRKEAEFEEMKNFDRIVQGLYVEPEDPDWFFRDPVLGEDVRRFFDYAKMYCRSVVRV